LEKKGIPTVTVATSAFEELVRSTMKDQGDPHMALVLVEHPIAGRNKEETGELAKKTFPDLLKAATQWQPKM